MRIRHITFVVLLILWGSVCEAKTLYVAQSSAGSNDGTSCSNAFAATWFNTFGSWSATVTADPTKVGPGDTIRFCGTISTTLLTQNSGLSGNPITLAFEPGASLSQPVCPAASGCLRISSRSYIIVDGEGAGVIESTANGSVLANKTASIGLLGASCSNCEVKNLIIRNIYVHTLATDGSLAANSLAGIQFSGSNTSIHDNVISDAGVGIYNLYTNGNTGVSIYNNVITRSDHGMTIAGSGAISASGFSVYGNSISEYQNWDTDSNFYHHDGLHAFGVGGAVADDLNIYNNTFSANCGANMTAHVYLESNFSSRWTASGVARVFNNTFSCGDGVNGMLNVGSGTVHMYNNVLSGTGTTQCLLVHTNATVVRIINNVFSGCLYLVNISDVTTFPTSAAVDFNYNIYRTDSASPWNWKTTSPFTTTFSEWKTECSCDANSATTSDVLVTSIFKPRPGSPLIDAGTNLTSLGITALNSDKGANARPGAGAWNAGAYETTAILHNVAAHRTQRVYIEASQDIGGNNEARKVVDGGAVAILYQIDCPPGEPCENDSFALCYSTDGVTYGLVPNTFGVDAVAHWNISPDPNLNNGSTSGVLTGSYTPLAGTTQTTATPTSSPAMAASTSRLFRWIPRVGAIAGQTRYFRPCYADGTALDSYTPATGAQINIIPTQSGF